MNRLVVDIVIVVALFIAVLRCQIVLKACCNGDQNCEEFQRPEEMYGMSCCGINPYNQFEDICCNNVTRHRRQASGYVDRCCGNQTLSYDQTCCNGQVHNIPNGECCGSQAYARNSMNVLCCDGQLNMNVKPGSACCGSTPYDGGIRESCCGGQVLLKELFDGCCPVYGSKPPEFRQFNSRTHQCCDVPIQRNSNNKCCYLRNENGTFVPKSYDFSTSCCAYPYKEITSKSNGQCIPTPAPPTVQPSS